MRGGGGQVHRDKTPDRARHFLMLQGPCGGFYRQLQHELGRRGHRCTRIVLNGGDLIDSRWGEKIFYWRSFADWPNFVTRIVKQHGVTDIVLYGDCRPYHRAAITAAAPLGVNIHVLEEGYLRPNWITYEKDGVNGNSRLVDLDLARIDEAKIDGAANPAEMQFASSQLRYMLAGFAYYAWQMLLTPLFPRYVPHRDLSVTGEAALWLGRFCTWPKRRKDSIQALRRIEELGKPVHLVLLQLNGDSQIKEHSPFRSVRHFVEYCIAEFKAAGTSEAILVFKNHPLDNGVINLGRLIREESARWGLEDRVFFVETGKLVPLLDRTISVTAVNSTACHQSLRRGIPTLVLGKAVYNHPEITPRMRLADFFRLRPAMTARHYDVFVGLLRQTCQVNGGFYGRFAQRTALADLCDRMMADHDPLQRFLRPETKPSKAKSAS